MKKKSESKCIYVRKRIFYQKGLHVCVCVDVCVCECVWVNVCGCRCMFVLVCLDMKGLK